MQAIAIASPKANCAVVEEVALDQLAKQRQQEKSIYKVNNDKKKSLKNSKLLPKRSWVSSDTDGIATATTVSQHSPAPGFLRLSCAQLRLGWAEARLKLAWASAH